jgi:hypothetical protein
MTGQLRAELTDDQIERMIVERSGSRAPADLVSAIISAAEGTSQRRARLLPALPRFAQSRAGWLLVGAVLALLALGAALVVGSYLIRPRTTLEPAALRSGWTSVGTRVTPYQNGNHILRPSNRVDIVISEADVGWQSLKADVLNSKALVGPDTLELRLLSVLPPELECRRGDAGTYTFSLSSSGQNLTLTPTDDTCETRAAVLAGDWIRNDIGDLAPGRHVSLQFRPFGGGTSGQFSYVVPSGWVERYECQTCVFLNAASSDLATINVWSNVAPSTGDASCASPVDVGRTSAAIAAWLTALPGLVATAPTPVTIGDLHGFTVDLSLARDWIGTCGEPSVLTFSGADGTGMVVVGQTRDRYVLLDRGDGQTLLIQVQAPDNETWDAVIAAAMPIVESFEFIR